MSDALNNLIAGSIAGMASTVVCHPFDTIRTRLQVDHGKGYEGVWDCTKQAIRKEGDSFILIQVLLDSI